MTESLAEKIGQNYAIESSGTHVLFVHSGKRVESISDEVKVAYEILQEIVSKH